MLLKEKDWQTAKRDSVGRTSTYQVQKRVWVLGAALSVGCGIVWGLGCLGGHLLPLHPYPLRRQGSHNGTLYLLLVARDGVVNMVLFASA